MSSTWKTGAVYGYKALKRRSDIIYLARIVDRVLRRWITFDKAVENAVLRLRLMHESSLTATYLVSIGSPTRVTRIRYAEPSKMTTHCQDEETISQNVTHTKKKRDLRFDFFHGQFINGVQLLLSVVYRGGTEHIWSSAL